MRLRNIMLMLAASAMLIATACDKDEDDSKTPEPEQNTKDAVFHGTYALSATMGPTTMTATNDTTGVKIAYAGDNKIKVTLPATELKESHSLFPSATVEVETMTNADGTISINETEFETAPDAAGKTCKGKISGLINNDKLTLTGEEKYGNMPVTCTIIFPYIAE